MPPPERFPSDLINPQIQEVISLINQNIPVYTVNFSGPTLSNFHEAELTAILRNTDSKIIQPYIQPIAFFTSTIPNSQVYDLLASSSLIKNFGLVCAISNTPDNCVLNQTKQLVESHYTSNCTFKMIANFIGDTSSNVEAKIKIIDQIQQQAGFATVTANLKNPDLNFTLIYDFISDPTRFIFSVSRFYQTTKRSQIQQKLTLKSRKYLGPTSMDAELAGIMINLANLKQGDFVVDPFCGTCSILTAAASSGMVCFGGDFDFKVLRGRKNLNYVDNCEQYQQNLPEICQQNIFKQAFSKQVFDAVICDPPYSIRATAGDEFVSELYLQLVRFSQKVLKVGGKLIFWMPVPVGYDKNKQIFNNSGMKQIGLYLQDLTRKYGRILIEMEKIEHIEECNVEFNGKCYLDELRTILGLEKAEIQEKINEL